MAAERVRRVLVVDDEENTRLALTRLLSREGYQVRTASNGNEALCQLRNNPAELIITDLNMPEMNGLTFLRELNREYPMCNVIMITPSVMLNHTSKPLIWESLNTSTSRSAWKN